MPDTTITNHPSSYRDPSGFVFMKNAVVYRQVNSSFRENFKLFNESGLYDELVKDGLLIPHEVLQESPDSDTAFAILKPEMIPFVSYPYEWTFDMLKDAALLTLQLVKKSLKAGMILKDATPFNIQWHKGRPIFIDTLSFEKYEESPWIAYRQFCEAFLGPLLIMHYSKRQLPELMLSWPNGIPLTTIQRLIPSRSRFSLFTYLHIHMHAKYSLKPGVNNKTSQKFPQRKLENLVGSLESLIKGLRTPEQKSTWSEYYDEASRREDYLETKKMLINEWVREMPEVKTAIDLGANEGEFSQILADRNIHVIAADLDPYCINNLYKKIKGKDSPHIQPIVLDLSNPSPALGWANRERDPFLQRAKADLVMGLALIHHLAIGKNIPFEMIAGTFSEMGRKLILEYVPKSDEKVRQMLSYKKDIYTNYTEKDFELAFSSHYTIIKKSAIGSSGRILYLFEKR